MRPKPGDDVAARENLAVTAPFEPGSVFKVITLSAALETTRPAARERDLLRQRQHHAVRPHHSHDHNSYASLAMEDVLARSSNIGAINIGLKVGDANMYDYLRRFGFGKRTGIPLPGESAGMVRPLKRWQKSSIGSVAMGHEISVTSAATGAGLLRDCQRRLPGEAQAGAGRADRSAGADAQARDRHHHAPHDGRRGDQALRHGLPVRAHSRLYVGGKTGTAQIYDFKAHVIHAPCTTLRSWVSRR